MSEIQVTPSQLRTKAEGLETMNRDLKKAISELEAEKRRLDAAYDGESSKAFDTEFAKDITQMNNFYNAIAKYAQNLEAIAEQYEQADQEARRIAGERKYK